MIISVASGKGGTGKTTVATNLAYSLNTNVQILDCDVEEPNAHLFLKPKMENSIPVLATVPAVDKENAPFAGSAWRSAASMPLPLWERQS